jgi:Ca-activated chloride channel family protein
MKKLTYIFILYSFFGFSQDKDKALIQANDLIYAANELVSEDFVNAEIEYRKAISKKPSNAKGTYNLGNAYYNSGLYDEAMLRHLETVETATTKKEKHRAYHNIGNAFMKQNLCKEAVEAFKNALRNNPSDDETRYNFALAKECAEQQGQGDNDESEDENKEDKKEDEKKDQEDKDKGDDKEDNKDQEGDDEKKDQEGDDKEDDKGKPDDDKDNKDPNNQNKNQQQQPGKLSPQQVKNLLEAMNNQEKKVQEKINAKKAKGPKVKAEKDW